MQAYVRSECRNGITTIEFFHPGGNALTVDLLASLTAAIQKAGSDPHSKVIQLRSAGAAVFSKGLPRELIHQLKSREDVLNWFRLLAGLIITMQQCPQFIIVRVQGKAYGEAIGLIAGADYAIAIEEADVRLEEPAPDAPSLITAAVIERKLGSAAYQELAVDTDKGRNAEWARKTGLFAELYAAPDTMEEAIFRLLNFLAHLDPTAMANMKKVLWEETRHWEQLLTQKAEDGARLIHLPAAGA